MSPSKIENVEDTVVVSRTVVRARTDDKSVETEIDLTSAEAARDLESVLPMIDFSEISNIRIVERRRQIVNKTKVRLCMLQSH